MKKNERHSADLYHTLTPLEKEIIYSEPVEQVPEKKKSKKNNVSSYLPKLNGFSRTNDLPEGML